jgi:hypothetical protein
MTNNRVLIVIQKNNPIRIPNLDHAIKEGVAAKILIESRGERDPPRSNQMGHDGEETPNGGDENMEKKMPKMMNIVEMENLPEIKRITDREVARV